MKLKPNKLHLQIALIFLPFLLLSALTGFFRANYKWFWKDDYMKVKRTTYENKIGEPSIPINAIFKKADEYFHKRVEIEQIKLKPDAGRLFYEVKVKNEHSLLIDGMTGESLSPLGEDLVKKISSQYIREDLEIESIQPIVNYVPRKLKKVRPVYEIRYKDDLDTKIYLDLYTGEIVEELDTNLSFGMWMVKLHDYDFWDMKRFNLNLVALGIISVGFTGFYIWLRKKKRTKEKIKQTI